MQVLNRSVLVLHNKFVRFLKELKQSQSRGVSVLSVADRDRLLSYIEDARQYIAFTISQPFTDEPESHPWELDIPDEPSFEYFDNTNLMEAALLLHVMIKENANSQSARFASGFISFDFKRLNALLDKFDNLIINYIDKAPLLDLPETAPDKDYAPDGKGGIGTGSK